MSSQYSLDDKTAGREFLIMGGRSFDALERFLNAHSSAGSRVRIIHECEYVGGGYDIPEPVHYDGRVVSEDATIVLVALSGADPAFRIGGYEVRDLIESFEELKAWALAHPDNIYRPQYCE